LKRGTLMRDEVELYVTFRDGRELLYLTPLGNNQYRLEVTSVGGHLRYGDTIEVGPPLNDRAVPYRRIIRRSGLRTQCFVLSKKLMESRGMRDFAKQIEALGGHWEGIAGGVLVVHVPRTLDLDIQQELKRIQRNLE
jgi:hypothetical protein